MKQIYFLLSKFSYYLRVKINRFLSRDINDIKYKKIIKDLDVDGISFVENFLSRKKIESIKNEVEPILKKLIKFPLKQVRFYRNVNEGLFRIYKITKNCPSTRIFFNSPLIRTISKFYISQNTSFYQDMAEIRQAITVPPSSLKGSSDNFHFDDWRIRLKFFLLLEDITPDRSPLQYVKGSHKINKYAMELDLFCNGRSGKYGFYKNEEVKKLLKKNKLKITMCTGKKGTLIIVNTGGLHKGTPLIDKKHPRIQLGLYSDLRKIKWNPKNINVERSA